MAANGPYVLDSSALVALLANEPGAEAVRERIPGAAIPAPALGEAATVLMRHGGEVALVEQALRGLELDVVPWTEALAYAGLDLSPLAWTHGLSLVDRICLTLARSLGRPALTADATWGRATATLRPKIPVELFR